MMSIRERLSKLPKLPKFSSIRYRIRKPVLIGQPSKQSISTLQTGNLVVISIPPGARIYIDDIPTDIYSSSIVADISTGPHSIKLSLPGYTDYIDDTTISDGETGMFLAIMEPVTPPTGTGTLDVTSTPTGVEFGLYKGLTGSEMAPVIIYDMPAGINAYEADNVIDYGMALGSFVIEDGKTTNLHIPLFPETTEMGFVAIETIPMGAQIFIDGVDIGAHTSYMTIIESGTHTYELRLPGYQIAKGEFIVVTSINGFGAPAIVSVTLEKESIGAIMLIGAAAVGMMLLSK